MKVDKVIVEDILDEGKCKEKYGDDKCKKYREILYASYRFEFWWRNIKEIMEGDEGVNIGVVGDWGTGKTTFLRMIKYKAEKEGYPVVFYEAWRYQQDPDILLSLLQVLAENLGDVDEVRNLPQKVFGIKLDDTLKAFKGKDNIIEKLKSTLFEKLQNLNVNINFDFPLVGGAKFSIGASSQLNACNYVSTRTMNKIYRLLANAAEKIKNKKGKPLILIVDDVDRLLSHRAFQLLEDLRFYFYTNNIIVFTGVNENILARHIAKYYDHISETEAERFLRKIVNFRISLSSSNANEIHLESLVTKTKDDEGCWKEFFNYVISNITDGKGIGHRSIIVMANEIEERVEIICKKLRDKEKKIKDESELLTQLFDWLSYALLDAFFPSIYSYLGNKDHDEPILPPSSLPEELLDKSVVSGLSYENFYKAINKMKQEIKGGKGNSEEGNKGNPDEEGKSPKKNPIDIMKCIKDLIISQCKEEKQ